MLQKICEKGRAFAAAAWEKARRGLVLGAACTAVALGTMASLPTVCHATDPPPITLDGLGSGVDVGGMTVAMGSKIGASWTQILLVIFAFVVVGIIVAYVIGATRKTVK